MTTEAGSQRGWWDRNLTVAVIAAVAAIVGAGIGALATYYGNRNLQEEQAKATARGVARVLSSQFQVAEERVALALEEDKLIPPGAVTEVSLSPEDEQLLASNLSLDSWIGVAVTISNLEMERRLFDPSGGNAEILKARAGLRVPFQEPLRKFEGSLLDSLNASINSLHPLAAG